MPSPFPGMDPFLEDRELWQGFHSRFINACCELLLDRLPAGYDADIEERVQLVEVAVDMPERFRPDVSVSRDSAHSTSSQAPESATAVSIRPITIPSLPTEEVIEPSIRIS